MKGYAIRHAFIEHLQSAIHYILKLALLFIKRPPTS